MAAVSAGHRHISRTAGFGRVPVSTAVILDTVAQETAQYTAEHITLRRIRTADVEPLVVLEKLSFRSYYEPHRFDADQFRYYLANDDTISQLALNGTRPVGYVLGKVVQRGENRSARVDSVAVSPSMRRSGIGRRLMRFFTQQTHNRGCRRIWLEVADRNRGGIALFESLGYRRYRRLPDHYGPGVDGLRMRLEFNVPNGEES